MDLDPVLAIFALGLTAILAVLSTPLSACLLIATIATILLNPHPLPENFLLEHGLAIRLNSPALISIPLFGLASELAVLSGITTRLLNLADALGLRTKQSVGPRTILGCALFASVSGVGPAAVAAEGKRLAPAMLANGYSKPTAAGAIACAAALSIVIPASVPLTVYAATIGILTNVVFTASFVPGLVLAVSLLVAMRALSHKQKISEAVPGRTATAISQAKWAILLPCLVLTALFTGFLTAPEAAAFSCAYALAAARLHGIKPARGELLDAFARAATGAAIILILTATSGLFILLVNMSGVTADAADFIHAHAGGKIGSILFMNCLLLAAGCVLDMPAIITVVAPLLLPLAERSEMSMPHFGVMVVMNIAIGLVTPPQAWNLTAAATTVGIHPREAARGALPFLAVMIFVLLLVSFAPELSLWFPRIMGWPV